MDAKNKIFTVIGSIALIAATATGGYLLLTAPTSNTIATSSKTQAVTQSTAESATNTPSTSTGESTGAADATTTSSYKDGTYTATASYSVPHGEQNSIAAEVTVAAGKIVSVKTTDNYSDHESAMYISGFESSVNSSASGQSLATYSPSRIGGASLTTAAFDDALDTIRSQAMA